MYKCFLCNGNLVGKDKFCEIYRCVCGKSFTHNDNILHTEQKFTINDTPYELFYTPETEKLIILYEMYSAPSGIVVWQNSIKLKCQVKEAEEYFKNQDKVEKLLLL